MWYKKKLTSNKVFNDFNIPYVWCVIHTLDENTYMSVQCGHFYKILARSLEHL